MSRLNSVGRVRGCSMVCVDYPHTARLPRCPRFESGRRDQTPLLKGCKQNPYIELNVFGCCSCERKSVPGHCPNSVEAYHGALSRPRPGFESRFGRTKLFRKTPVLPGSKLTSNFVFYNFVTDEYIYCLTPCLPCVCTIPWLYKDNFYIVLSLVV